MKTHHEAYLAAKADGWVIMSGGKGTTIYTRDGQYGDLFRVEPAPPENTPEWYDWMNGRVSQNTWELRILTAEQAAPTLDRIAKEQAEMAPILAEIKAYHEAWDKAHPRIPMSKGGLAALIAADKPS